MNEKTWNGMDRLRRDHKVEYQSIWFVEREQGRKIKIVDLKKIAEWWNDDER